MKKLFISIGLLLALAGTVEAVVNTGASRVVYSGNTKTTSFTFTFPVLSSADLEVYLGSVKQTAGYTLTLNSNQTTNPGGTVVFAIAPSVTVTIQRTVPGTQTVALTPYSPFPAKTVEGALDRTAMQAIQADRHATDTDVTHAADKATQAAADLAQDARWTAAVAALNGTSHAQSDLSSVLALGTTTPRTLTARFASDWVNVLDTGAVCNGATDDGPALVAANALAVSKQISILVPCKMHIASSVGDVNAPITFVLSGGFDFSAGASALTANKGISTTSLNQLFFANSTIATPLVDIPDSTTGTLAVGSYVYRISAISASGETWQSARECYRRTTTGGITVKWRSVIGATGYKIYGRTFGDERYMATVGAVTSWTDDGSITPGTARSLVLKRVSSMVPEWWGAQGDGSTDDTSAIQEAVYASQVSGGKVELTAGTYIVRGIELYNGTQIKGAGTALTTLKLAPSLTSTQYAIDATGHAFGGFVVLFSSYPSQGYNGGVAHEGITVSDLTVDGNGSTQTLSYYGWGIYLNSLLRGSLNNLVVKNCLTHGWTLKETSLSIVRNVHALNNGLGTGKGDGGVLLSHCNYNLVTESSAIENSACGFEDEGRFGGSYLPYNRNIGNRWVDNTLIDNGDNGFDAIFTDQTVIRNMTITGGSTSPNAGAFQLVGTTDVDADGVWISDSGRAGVRVWPEVYADYGLNYRVNLKNFVVKTSALQAFHIEGVTDINLQAIVRGVGGGDAISFSAIGYGRTGGVPACTSGGYGQGQYATGLAYEGYPDCYGYGSFVQSNGNVYELTTPYPEGHTGTTPPTGYTTSEDNGGVWTFRNRIGSSNANIKVDYDGSWGVQARYGLHIVNGTDIRITDTDIKDCWDSGIWIDGTPAGTSGVLIDNTRSRLNDWQGIAITSGTLTAKRMIIANSDFTDNTSIYDFSVGPAEIAVTNVLGFAKITYAQSVPTTGVWKKKDLVFNALPAAGVPMGWVRITNGSGNVLNVDWLELPDIPTP